MCVSPMLLAGSHHMGNQAERFCGLKIFASWIKKKIKAPKVKLASSAIENNRVMEHWYKGFASSNYSPLRHKW